MDPFDGLPVPRGLDPLYFNRRRSLEGALRWAGAPDGMPRTCIDVGANEGQTMRSFLEWWPTARCVSFEPLPQAYEVLAGEARRWGDRAVIHRLGASDVAGNLTLHANRSQSTDSSFRQFNRGADSVTAHRGLRGYPSHLEGLGEDDYETEVEVIRLDDHVARAKGVEACWYSDGVDLLKSDTGGWDLRVIAGAGTVLRRTRVVLVEWTLDDVYGRPEPVAEIDRLMTDAGLRLWDVAHVYKDLVSLRTLWVDLVYARPTGATDR